MIVVLVVAILGSIVAYYFTQLNSPWEEELSHAADFLFEQYNAQLRLCSEAPNVAPNIYWLASDNLMVYHAIEIYYPDTSNQIYLELERRDGFQSGVYEPLFGQSIPLPVKEKITYIIEQGENYIIKTEVHNYTVNHPFFPNWDEYANLLICSALSHYWEGNVTEACSLFVKGGDILVGKVL